MRYETLETHKKEIPMKNCILCGKQTEGSIGAAGFRWSIICQPCKDSEDKALADRLGYEAKVMNRFWNMVEATQ